MKDILSAVQASICFDFILGNFYR